MSEKESKMIKKISDLEERVNNLETRVSSSETWIRGIMVEGCSVETVKNISDFYINNFKPFPEKDKD